MQAALMGDLGQQLSEQTRRVGLNIIGWADLGFLNALGNNKRPVHTPADVVGLKLRSFGVYPVYTAQHLGAAALNLSSAETYVAIQRGVIDGGVSLATSFYSRNWYEVISDLTIVPLGYVAYAIYANDDWLQELDPRHQEILREAAAEMTAFTFDYTAEANANAIAKMKEAGVDVYIVPEEDYPIWQTILEPVYDIFLEQTGKDGRALLDAAAQYRK
ncbi:TRAP transporter substrate-binding protein [Aurantimonas sp. C2-6-R+9]